MSFVTNLKWDQVSERTYETGVRRGVIYPQNDDGTYGTGVAWNGLVSVTESPSGAESNPIYADDIKYLDIRSAEEFGATVQAYTYPKEFALCDGSASLLENQDFIMLGQQARRAFALCYTTRVGNDVKLNDFSYKIHILYGCTASPSEREYQTVNDSPEAIQFSWELTTTPIAIPTTIGTFKDTSNITIDVSQIMRMETADRTYWLGKVEDLEKKLYGIAGDSTASPAVEPVAPSLALPEDLAEIFVPRVGG